MALLEKDKMKALTIVRVFETGKPFGDYAAVAVLDDGAGISYGINQFTHRSGSLFAVTQKYLASGSQVGLSVIEENLQTLKKKTPAAIVSLAGNEQFKKALKAAAITREMRVAQDETAFDIYLKPALVECARVGFELPLSLAVVYDSMTQGGWERIRAWVAIADAASGVGKRDACGPVNNIGDANEKAWIAEYVAKRDAWLGSVARLRKTRYRTKFFLDQIRCGNWQLRPPLDVNGARLTEAMFTDGIVSPTCPVLNSIAADESSEDRSNSSNTQNRRVEQLPLFPIDKEDQAVEPPHGPTKTTANVPPTNRENNHPSNNEARPPDFVGAKSGSGGEEEKGSGGEKENRLTTIEDRIDDAAAIYDRVETAVEKVVTRTDSAKSLWTTVVGTVWQTTWALIGFIAGLPREVWFVVAVIVGTLMLLYLYRQVVLGKMRERRDEGETVKK